MSAFRLTDPQRLAAGTTRTPHHGAAVCLKARQGRSDVSRGRPALSLPRGQAPGSEISRKMEARRADQREAVRFWSALRASDLSSALFRGLAAPANFWSALRAYASPSPWAQREDSA